jgi:hypothetical protein
VPEVDEAAQAFKEALDGVSDPETRNLIDMAVGKISRAYQILGFCERKGILFPFLFAFPLFEDSSCIL